MPLQHTIDEAAGLVVVSGPGDAALKSAQDSFTRLLADERVRPHFKLLILVERSAPSPEGAEVRAIAQFLRLLRTKLAGPVAIVAPGETQATAATLIALEGSTDDRSIRWFSSETAARTWLATGAA
jgi:hypothetical protein